MVSLYTDAITGDDLFSSAFPIKEVDNAVYEVDCQMVQVKKSSGVEEEQVEEGPEEVEEVNDVVEAFGLKQAAITKSGYLSYFKDYKKRVKDHLASTPDQAEEFEKYAVPYVKKVISHFAEYDFYTGRSMNTMGMIALLRGRDGDSSKPYFTFWKHGLDITKV